MPKPACVYLPLEPVKSRYTYDLCNKDDGWMVKTLKTVSWRQFFYGGVQVAHLRPDIKTGAVLDAYTRSSYAMKQCEWVCGLLDKGMLKNGDVLYLQDFWTPGLEAILYCAHMCNVKLRIYAMVHAQSVDQYDFTHDMRHWMRPIELGYAKSMSGLFVASSIHKEQLRLAGVECPIHVVSLPYDERINTNKYRIGYCQHKDRTVIYSSRIDKEKQPEFMLRVAKSFLEVMPEWKWVVTTSSDQLRSYNNAGVIKDLRAFARRNKRFIIREGLTKQEYHYELEAARIQFNCSLQDYVSWTLIEACHHRCYPVYPNFRSFPECLSPTVLYKPWSYGHAVHRLIEAARDGNHCAEHIRKRVLLASLEGRFHITRIVYGALTSEINVWELT